MNVTPMAAVCAEALVAETARTEAAAIAIRRATVAIEVESPSVSRRGRAALLVLITQSHVRRGACIPPPRGRGLLGGGERCLGGAGDADRAPGPPGAAVALPHEPCAADLLLRRGAERECGIAGMRERRVGLASHAAPRLRRELKSAEVA